MRQVGTLEERVNRAIKVREKLWGLLRRRYDARLLRQRPRQR
jgi:hypothetical protein